MAEGRLESEWSQTANQMALLANCNRDPKQRREAFTAQDFNPMAQPSKPPPKRKVSVDVLKAVFVDKRMPTEEEMRIK